MALAAASVLGVVVMASVVASGQRGGETISDNWWISGPAVVAGMSAIASFVTGLVGVLLRHERSLLGILAVLAAGLATVLLIGELASAH